ncbi:unnamed protein product [Nippostrongylus brasiliensis]|uniref:Uncharacterized protein n=1 Tax=Nippostrongylus brasiliensis TaxID=27835 RepID=A0A0N4XVT7_NIPBR|nr:unnamed protein product [Nippostrongylus brasiliensis]
MRSSYASLWFFYDAFRGRPIKSLTIYHVKNIYDEDKFRPPPPPAFTHSPTVLCARRLPESFRCPFLIEILRHSQLIRSGTGLGGFHYCAAHK